MIKVHALLFFAVIGWILAPLVNADPTKNPLIQQGDTTYLGAYRLPSEANYGGRALVRNPETDTIYSSCSWGLARNRVLEATTPAPANTTIYADLPLATIVQPCADITDGHLGNVSGIYTDEEITGSFLSGGEIITTARSYYPAGTCDDQLTHGKTPGLDLSVVNDFTGFTRPDVAISRAYAGYMTDIPVEWQALFGGSALTGAMGGPITSCSSSGPSLAVFDPANVDGRTNPFPVTELMWYPIAALSDYVATEFFWESSPDIMGVGFPAGSSSVLFVGSMGENPCYGVATDDPLLHDLTSTPKVCYDLCKTSHGAHGYPYKAYVWAYDANDLLKVINGEIEKTDVRHYAKWEIPELADNNCVNFVGASFDNANNIFSIAPLYGNKPIIHELQVTVPEPVIVPDPTPAPTFRQCVSDCLVEFPR